MFEIALEILTRTMVLMLPEMPTSLEDLPPGKKQTISNIHSLIYRRMKRKLKKVVEEAEEEINELYNEAMKENSNPTE